MPIYATSTPRLKRPAVEQQEPGILNEFGKGVGAGIDQLQGLIGGGGRALVGSLVGNDDLFFEGMEYYNEQMAEAAENQAEVGRIEDIEGLGDLALYSSYIIGNFVPSLAGGVGTGAAAGSAAKLAFKKGINKKAQQAAEKQIKDVAEQELRRKAARDYAATASARVGNLGRAGGALAFAGAAGSGESFTRIMEETGEERAGVALATGITSGALDALTPMRVLKKILPQGSMKKAREAIGDGILSDRSRIVRALKEGAKTGGVEATTEMLQEVAQSYAVEFVKAQDDPSLEGEFVERMFDEEKRSMYANAFVAGLVGGKGIGMVQGGLSGAPARQSDTESLPAQDTEPQAVTEEADEQLSTEQTPAEEMPRGVGEARSKILEVRRKAQGLPQRRTARPITPAEARARVQRRQGVPTVDPQAGLDVGDAKDPNLFKRRREEIRARVREQIDSLPRARQQARAILQRQFRETSEDIVSLPQEVQPEPESETGQEPGLGGLLPQNIASPLDSLVGKDVEYQGNKGLLTKREDGFYIVTQDNDDVFIESGEYQSPEAIGVTPAGVDLEFERDVRLDPATQKFELREKIYTLNQVVRDAQGKPVSLAVTDESGNKKTIRTPEVVGRLANQKAAQSNTDAPIKDLYVPFEDLPTPVKRNLIATSQSAGITLEDEVPADQARTAAQQVQTEDQQLIADEVESVIRKVVTINSEFSYLDNLNEYRGGVRRATQISNESAVAEVNQKLADPEDRATGTNRTPLDAARLQSLMDVETETRDPESQRVMPSLRDYFSVSQGKGTKQFLSQEQEELLNSIADLVGEGMPKAVLNSVKGIAVSNDTDHPMTRGKAMSFNRKTGSIILSETSLKNLTYGGDKKTREERFFLAHEIGHAFDVRNSISSIASEFAIAVDGASNEGINLEVGEALAELYENYSQQTPLGRELSYPFGYVFELINNNPTKVEQYTELLAKEAFAQSFAVFHADAGKLENQAPFTYNFFTKLLREKPTETTSDGQNNDKTNQNNAEREKVRGDIRAPAEPRGAEVQEPDGDRGTSRDGTIAQQAGEGLAGETQADSGDDTGRLVPVSNEDAASQPIDDQQDSANADISPDDFLGAPPRRGSREPQLPDETVEQRKQRAEEQGYDTSRVYYHGTGYPIEAFDADKRGSVTDARSAKKGFWFSDSARTAQSYAHNTAVNRPVQAIIQQANAAEAAGDYDGYDRLLGEAEALEKELDGDRRNGQNIIPVYLPKDADLLIKDMKGRSYDDFGVSDEIADLMDSASRDGRKGVKLLNLNDAAGLAEDPATHVAIFDPSNIRSVNAKFDPAKTDSPELLSSPPRQESAADTEGSPATASQESSDSDLNKAIREQQGVFQAIKNKFKKSFQRNMTARGLLPETVFDEKIKRDSELGVVELDIRQMQGYLNKAIKENYGELSEENAQLLNDALGENFAEIESLEIPAEVKKGLVHMRTYLDNISKRYISALTEDAEQLAASGDPAALEKAGLIGIIAGNIGSYLHRSFRVFDDPNWYKKVPDEILNNAREYLTNNGSDNVERTINEILKNNTAYDSFEAFISESKLGAKDLSILKKKNHEIAPEILALLGEYRDPRVNFAKSATKMSRLVFNDAFLKNVKAKGEDVFLFTKDTAPSDAYVPIAAEGSKVMEPLNGYHATPEVAQAFKDALDQEQMPNWLRLIVQANGMVKYGKTVIAPTTVARNWLSASMFTVANGHFNLAKVAKSAEVFKTYFSAEKGEQLNYLKKIKKLGVVYDTPYAGELMDLLKDTGFGNDMTAGTGAKGRIKDFFKLATRFYQFGDDFWKIVGFENEVDILMDAKGISREDAEPLAAQRIRDTYPTYSLIGRFPQKLRRFPLAGTFVSFPAEIIRTQFNMLRYMKQDMADPDMADTVARRALGFAMISGGAYAIQEALLGTHDVSEDEEEAIRLLSPEWSRNSNIAITGRDEDGNLQYVDLTHLDPYAFFKKPLNAILRDQPAEDAIVQAGRELLEPFFGTDISTAALSQLWANEKASGGRIYNGADSPENIAADMSAHLIKSMGPSVIQNINRLGKAINGDVSGSGRRYKLEEEYAALAGFRVATFDPKVSLHFKAYDFNESKRAATSILTGTFRDPNEVTDAELASAFDRASRARKQAFEDMRRVVESAKKAGLSNTQATMVLRSNGVTRKDAKALVSGKTDQWSLSDSTLKNSIKKSDLLFGKSTSKEFLRRWELILKLLKGES